MVKLYKTLKTLMSWTKKEVMEMTLCCASLRDAINCLAYKLTDDTKLHYTLKPLIEERFAEDWLIATIKDEMFILDQKKGI